jgi:hypothetical protein
MAKIQKLGLDEDIKPWGTDQSPLLIWAHRLLFLSALIYCGFYSAGVKHVSPAFGRKTNYVFVQRGTGIVQGGAYVRKTLSGLISFGGQVGAWLFMVGIVLLLVGAAQQEQITPKDWASCSIGRAVKMLLSGAVMGFIIGGILGFFV